MRGSLAHSIRVGELLRVEASAWLHSTSEAVSESPQSVPPFTARDGALKSGGFSRTALCWGSLTTLNPGWGALKSGGLSLLHSAPKAVSEAPQSLHPYCQRRSPGEWWLQKKDSLKWEEAQQHSIQVKKYLFFFFFFFFFTSASRGQRRISALAPPFDISIPMDAGWIWFTILLCISGEGMGGSRELGGYARERSLIESTASHSPFSVPPLQECLAEAHAS